MRYVAIGAIVGFLIAWFLLNSGRDAGPPAVQTAPVQTAPVQTLPSLRPTPAQLREMQRLPEGAKPRAAPL